MLITSLKNATKKILINKKFKTTVVLMLLIYILFSSVCSSFASNGKNLKITDMSDVGVPLTAERAGNYVANFAINFEANYAKKSQYSDVTTEIGDTYNGKSVDGKYCFNNISWISFVYNQCLQLHENSEFDSKTIDSYVIPHTKNTDATWEEDFFEQIKFNGDAYAETKNEETGETKKTENLVIGSLATNDEIQPGDILIKSKNKNSINADNNEPYIGQVLLYIGAGQVIYCKSPETEDDKEVFVKCYVDDLDFTIDTVVRIKEETAQKILDTDTTLIFAGKGYDPKITYQGIPGKGTYLGTTTAGEFFKWLVECIGDILDYLIGIITYALRAVLIGWTNLVENLVHDTLLGTVERVNKDTQSSTHHKVVSDFGLANGSYVNSLTGKANNLDTRVSIEDIIFNKIPILDVNFFGVEEAGGAEIAQDSIVYMIRSNIANWYYIIRLISIVIMVLVLIYVGIRIAITTTGERKAQFKTALTGWVIGFIEVIAIHFFMYILFQINEFLVGTFQQTALQMNGGEFSLYETIRTKSYAPKFTEGFGSTIMYMFLVFVLIKFSIIYFKRYLTVTILGLLGPIIGLKYSIERATGRKTKSISNWMFEFAMNVLIQSMHALLYVCLMQIAISMAFTSLAGYLVALVILNFMLKADKIFMQIFNFDRSKSVGDTVQQEGIIQQFAKYTIGAKLTIKAVKGVGKGIVGIGRTGINIYGEMGDLWKDREKGETLKLGKNALYKTAGGVGRFLAGEFGPKPIRWLNSRTGGRISSIAALSLLRGTKQSKKMDEAAIAALKLNMGYTKRTFKRSINALRGTVGAATKLATAIPLTIVDPMAGIGAAYNAHSTIKSNIDRTALENARIQREYEEYLRHQDDEPDGKIRKALRVAGTVAASPAIGAYYGARVSGKLASFNGGKVAQSVAIDVDRYEEARMKNHLIIEKLKEADEKEREIEDLYEELKAETTRVNADLTAEEIREKTNKEFTLVAKEAAVKRVKSSTVKGAVDEYMIQHNLTQLSELDVERIMKIIARKETEAGKKLEFDSDVLENIRDSLQERIEANVAKKLGTTIIAEDMQDAIKDGLSKKGSIKSQKVDTSTGDRTEEIKAEIQEKFREYENLYEGSGKKVDSAKKVISKINSDDESKD